MNDDDMLDSLVRSDDPDRPWKLFMARKVISTEAETKKTNGRVTALESKTAALEADARGFKERLERFAGALRSPRPRDDATKAPPALTIALDRKQLAGAIGLLAALIAAYVGKMFGVEIPV